jgi:hypothetical protein
MTKHSTISVVALMLMLTFLFSCETIKTEKDFYKWISKEKNGLVKEKAANGFLLTTKFLPSELLAYREYKSDNSLNKDTLLKNYGTTQTFLLSIRLDTSLRSKGNIMFQGVEGYADYKRRILDFNFGIDEMIYIKYNNKIYKPLVHAFENTFNIVDGKNIYLVFDLKDLKSKGAPEEIDFIFEDQHFNTGISHFGFKKADLENLPKIEIFNTEINTENNK